ncbi:hypothetical protein CDD82_4563 [Ophiocordyceps australis]|uniref:Endonuclease/exonuclease/phosphatase domain-containing protein n=1 Tax=Ophiocordyceps australis TaxID=1399860 RepID=A0A2C5YZX7_9HYPO|nr:hypothetical protein CDD82_4563 [Ophiocordyceps australis]
MADNDGLPQQVRLLTLNCWGLLYISTLRKQRLQEIGRRLAQMEPRPDVVCLQECWVDSDFEAIRQATQPRLPHGKLFRAGVWGAGLAILSRWPLEETEMHQYRLNGRPTAFWRGDWYVGKGVAWATLRLGPRASQVMHVLNTHTHAPYEKDAQDSYACHRAAQLWHMAQLLRRATAQPSFLVVALGDFNMLPLSLPHRILTHRAPVCDAWRVWQPESSLGPVAYAPEAARHRPVPSAAFNLAVNGATSDGLYNTWRWTKNRQNKLRRGLPCPVDPEALDRRGKRLDYIFFCPRSVSPDHAWAVDTAQVALTERHADLHVSLSDHFAVAATLKLHPRAATSPRALHVQLAQSLASTAHGLARSDLDQLMALIRDYTARELGQRRLRALHFYASLVVWAVCLVAVWFSPRNFVAFVLCLVASLVLASGLVDGLLALLFFSSELRCLAEFEHEVRCARSAAAAPDAAGSRAPGAPDQSEPEEQQPNGNDLSDKDKH